MHNVAGLLFSQAYISALEHTKGINKQEYLSIAHKHNLHKYYSTLSYFWKCRRSINSGITALYLRHGICYEAITFSSGIHKYNNQDCHT